jgi:hypothetical protein
LRLNLDHTFFLFPFLFFFACTTARSRAEATWQGGWWHQMAIRGTCPSRGQDVEGASRRMVVCGPAKALDMKLLVLGRELKLPNSLFKARRTTLYRSPPLSLATSGAISLIIPWRKVISDNRTMTCMVQCPDLVNERSCTRRGTWAPPPTSRCGWSTDMAMPKAGMRNKSERKEKRR